MAVTPVASTENHSVGSSAVVDRPAGVQSGDLLIATLALGPAGTPTPPSGWALIRTTNSVHTYQKTAGGSEPSSYTWSLSASIAYVLHCTAYRGQDGTTPVAQSVGATGSSSSVTSPTLTTGADNALVHSIHGIRATGIPSVPASTTDLLGTGRTDLSLRTVYFTVATAGASGAKTATSSGSANWGAQQIEITEGNAAPNAPTLTSPIGGAVEDVADPLDLDGDFSDPDAGDELSEVTVQYRPVGGATTTVVEAASGTSHTTTLAGGRTTGNKEWRRKDKDNSASPAYGPYSGWAQWTDGDTPADPVITAPVGTITTDPVDLEWTAANQDAFEVEVRSAASGGGTLYHASGTQVSTARSYSTPAPVTGRTEYRRIRVRFAGLWSGWVETSNAVSFVPPEVPVLAVDTHPTRAALRLTITNPSGDTETVSNNVLRQQSLDNGETWTATDPNGRAAAAETYNRMARGADLGPDAVWDDWQVASRTQYRYFIEAVGANGTRTVSASSEGGAALPATLPITLL